MIEETATVVEVEGDFAWVETQRETACNSCAANKGCGTSVLSKVLGQRLTRVRALNRVSAAAGDTVVIGIKESALVRGSLAVYALPLVALLLAAVAGEGYATASGGNPEVMAISFGLVGLAAGFLWVRRFSERISRDARYQPVILRRMERPISGISLTF